ncbi:hypothetical protein BDW22DRAFT_1350266 [Trametopsis cervina]|nr:hypothetical protein BDW22DRAFT_1350266 [Trametopsis cervina]
MTNLAPATSASPPSLGIHDLPAEILVLIFEEGGRLTLQDDHLPFAVLATHVCRLWRRVALNTSSVWCSIPVHPLRPGLTEHFLSRSGRLPLDVCLHFKKVLKTESALATIFEHRRRWVNFYLRAGNGGGMYLVIQRLRAAGDSLPLLRHLGISVTAKPGTVGRVPEIFPDGDRPRGLESITMHGTSCDFRSPIFSGLTHLNLSFFPRSMGIPKYATFAELFRSAQHLTHLKLAGVFPNLTEGREYAEIELPALHTLELVMKQDEDYVPLFFSIICAPALQVLRFESRWVTTWSGFGYCVPIVSAKFAHLHTLSLVMATPGVSEDMVMKPEMFMCFPELRVLTLSAFHDYTLMHCFVKPWIAMYGAHEHAFLSIYEGTVFPKLDLLIVNAPFDTEEEIQQGGEDTLEEGIYVLGGLRLSCGLPMEVMLRPIFEEYVPDPLDVD